MTNEELIALAKTMLVESEVWIKEQGGETVNPGLMPKMIKSLEELIAENTRLRAQCEGLAQAAINNGQALIITESKLAKAVEALRGDPWTIGWKKWNERARTTLAEIEGEKT
jgi:hypothetical protein